MKVRAIQVAKRVLPIVLLVGVATALFAHDMFIKLRTYFLPSGASVEALLLNGTWTRSENAIARNRLADFSLAGPTGREHLDTTGIVARGDTTLVRFHTGSPGTYVLGVSLNPSEISLAGKDFNAYLKEEGISETLAERTRNGTLDQPAREQYSKHVKAILQVGDGHTDTYATVLGYPAEIVPLENPYGLKTGDTLRVRCLVDGIATSGLTVLAGGSNAQGRGISEITARTDASGVAEIPLRSSGRWYVKFISMRPSTEGNLTHRSRWATLTFQIR